MATRSITRCSFVSTLLPSLALIAVNLGCTNAEGGGTTTGDGGSNASTTTKPGNSAGGASNVGGSSTKASSIAATGVGGTNAAGGSVQGGSGGTVATSSAVRASGGSSVASGGKNPGVGGASVAATGGKDPGTGGVSVAAGGTVAGAGRGASGGKTAVGGGGRGPVATGGATVSSGGAGGDSAATGGKSSTPTGDVYNPDFKEFYGDDCQVSDPKDVKVSGSLPDLFLMADGTTRMSKKSDWRCQRAYLKKVIEKYVHGEKPGRPEKVTGSVSASAIKVHVENKGKSIDFSVTVSGVPSGASGPVPIIIGMGGSSLDASIVKGEGVASGTFDHQAMASETSRSGLFTTIYGSNGISAQIGWAWGISRVIDVLVDERAAGRNDIIDPTAVGVTGCSRNGKAAFNVGAFDERIALGIPQESGTGGVSAFRIVNTAPQGPNGKPAQSLDSAWSEAQGWFGTTFGTYRSKVDVIPGDTHSIAAMYAPRGLLVLDNSRIGELCASCQHAASAAAAELYAALGIERNIEYNGGNPSDPHNHCSFYPDTQGEPLKRAIRAFLTKKAAPDGRIAPQAAGTADLKKWVPWTAPTLTDDVSWDSPPLTKE